MPSEADIMISFAPLSNYDGSFETSSSGKIKVSAELKTITQADWNGLIDKFINILRLFEKNIFPTKI